MKLVRPNRRWVVLLTLLTLLPPGVWAFRAPDGPELPNLDLRAVGADGAAAVNTLKSRVPALQVYFDEHLGTPKWIVAQNGFLSGPGASGRAISPQTTAIAGTNDTYRATKAFLTEHQGLFGFGPEILATAQVTRDSITAHNGLRTVVWEQQLDGIRVFESLLISHTTKQEELVNLSSQLIPNPAQAAETGTPNRASVIQNPRISATAAISMALINLGETIDPALINAVESQPDEAEHRQHFTAPPLNGEADVKFVWLPMNATSLRLCWNVVLTSHARGEMYRLLVDVQTGEVLIRNRLTKYLSNASYRVWTSDSPSPFSPGCPTPCTTQPPVVSRTLVTWSALDANASPSGWIDDGGNETRGNNVDAHTDRDANDLPDLPRPHGSPFRTFDFTLDLAQAPVTYTNAAVVELFYWNNWMHDKLYELGFTEAAGNFQSNNFGRGGLGNDAVQADAQDGSGVNNANFSTPADGSPGRMQMYVFNGPTPDRDGDLDHEVVLHEYTHGLTERRVGGGVGIGALQTGGMGEGWSDWYALSLLSEPGDDANGVYASAAYASYLLSGLTTNYYFGIRRYPYCTDMTKNPLTFKDIDPSQASTHPGIPQSPIIGNQADEVHNMGEVWCVTLWGARANLITKYGYAVGNQLILELVTDGLNLGPANPTYIQARDAILQADVVDNGGADLGELWLAFAKRGMGSGASAPPSSTTLGVVESYTLPFPPITLTIPQSATEGDPPVLGQISVSSTVASNVTFAISCSDASQVTVPATVTLLAGQTITNFPITIIDDPLLDGPQRVTISVMAPGYLADSDFIVVADNETATLGITFPAAVRKGDGSVQGTITASAAPAANIGVSLTSSDITAIQVPLEVTLPAGQTSVVFTATVLADTIIDGDQSATITAHVPNWTDAQAIVIVHDNTDLVVTLPAAAREGDGTLTNAGTVCISGALTTNLIVSLLSSDTTELAVPPTTTILAGQTRATFSPTVIDDTEVDGPQTVTVTASAFGFNSGATNMIVNDNESPAIPSNPSPTNFATDVIQTTSLSWGSGAAPGEVITNDVYFGTSPIMGPADLQGTTLGTTWTLPNLSPLTTYYWQIVARRNGVVPGPVWQFTTRGADHFVWSSISSPQSFSEPFSATVTAKDIFEDTVSNFTGQVALSGSSGGTGILVVQTGVSIANSVRAAMDNLGQSYDFVQTDTLSSLNFSNYGTIVLGMNGNYIDYAGMASLATVVNNGARLIIMGGSAWPPYASGLNDFFIRINTNNYYWQTVSGSPKFSVIAPTHPLAVGLPATYNFNYVYASDYMTRITDGAATTVATNGDGFACLTTKPVGLGSLVLFINVASDAFWSQPADFAVLSTVISNSLFYVGASGRQPVPVAPTVSGAFSNGVWTGSIAALAPGTNVVLRADDRNGHFGLSNPFVVDIQNDISVSVQQSPDAVILGGSLTYTIRVANTGPDPATGVTVTNLLPANAALLSVAPSQGTVITNGNEIDCFLGAIPGAGSATIAIVASPIALATMTNQTSVSRAEPEAYLGNNTAIVTTAVQAPAISIYSAELYEGNSGTTNAVFTVSVSPPPAVPVTVKFVTSDYIGFGFAPKDYLSTNGVVNFAPGETNKSIIVQVVGNTAYEFTKAFFVNLFSPSNATLASSRAIGYIDNDDPMPTVSIGDVTLAEGNSGTTNAVFQVTLSAVSGVTTFVDYETANGSAIANSDYIAKSGSLEIPPGIAGTNITVPVNGDILVEPDEVFYVNLGFVGNANVLKGQGRCLIVNDDGLPGQLDHFAWRIPNPASYTGVPFSATITALDVSNNPATAFVGNANLTGFRGFSTNYILGNIPHTVATAGNRTLGYSFTPNTNLIVTHVRSYFGSKVSIWDNSGTLVVSQPVSGSVGTWIETPLPKPLALNAGTTYRVAAYSLVGFVGNYYWRTDGLNSFSNGIINASYASAGDAFPTNSDIGRWFLVDLRFTTGSAVTSAITPAVAGPFTNGTWTGNLTAFLPATNLTILADDDNGHFGLSNPFAVYAQNDVSVSVQDFPDPVSLGGSLTYTIAVPNTGPNPATGVTVTNVLPASAALLSVTPSQGTVITNGNEIDCFLGAIPGAGSATITIVATPIAVGTMVNQTTVYRAEPDTDLANNTAVVTTEVKTATISINDVTLYEGDSGTTNAVFTVSVSPPPVLPVTVSFATTDGSATAPSDYISTNGVLNFAPGETNKSIIVAVVGDTAYELNETFNVNLSSPSNATLADNVGIGTILNDDPIPTLSIGDVTITEGNSGTTNAVFPVTLSAASGLGVTFSYTTIDGSAVAGSDYVAKSGSLTIPPGFTSTNITVTVDGDLLIEADEVFYVYLSALINANLGKGEGNGLIVNDDGLPGQLDHFAWSIVSPTQYVGVPFNATITALDVFNNAATAFAGNANLFTAVAGGLFTNYFLGNIVPTVTTAGSFTLGYSFTPSTNITVTHVRSYFGAKVSIWDDSGALLAAQGLSAPAGTWSETPLSSPLALNAGRTYRVAAYSGGSSYYWRLDGLNSFTNGVINGSYDSVGDTFPTTPDSARWWFVDLRFTGGSAVAPLAPAVAGPFTNGMWTGNLTALRAATNLVVRADDANGHFGLSNPFNVELVNLAQAPLKFSTPQLFADGTLQLLVTASDGSPITPERASHIQLCSSADASLPLSSWMPVTVQTVLTNGILQINGLNLSDAPTRFFRAVETP